MKFYSSASFQTLFDYEGYSISSKGLLPAAVDILVIWIKFVHLSSLISKMSIFTLAISCLSTFSLPWFMVLMFQVPMQYCSFHHRTFTFTTRHIHNLALFLLRLSLFIPSGAISLLLSSSILGIYHPGEFIFQCHTFLPFHSVYGVLMARMLKWFAIPFSSGPRFVRNLHHEPSVLGGPTQHGSWFSWVRQGCGPCDQFG